MAPLGGALRALIGLAREDRRPTARTEPAGPTWSSGPFASAGPITPIASLAPRRRARVSGALRAVTYRPASHRPVLVGRLFDGTGSVDLVWLGRRSIAGLGPGSRLLVEGMVVAGRARPVIYNPSYTILGDR